MDVVKSNFTKILPQVEDAIIRSSFIAIDTEFTGLSVSPEDESSLFDSIDERYAKVRRTAHNFMICQFGLSAFVKEERKNEYTAYSYNFYLFPKDNGLYHNPRFLVQCSNIEFLCQHNFDFNKWIYQGIPYCNQPQEKLMCSEINGKDKRIEVIGFRHVFQLLVDSKKPILGHNMLLDIAYMIEKFYQPLPERYIDFKLLVHSLFPTIIDTKNVCHGIRKKLDQSELLENSSLEELYESLGSQKTTLSILFLPEVAHSKKTNKYSSGNCFHEAAFDAYCVGFVFLRLSHLLSMQGVKSTEARPVHVKQYMKITEPYANRINLLRGPIAFIDLVNPDQPTKERDMFLIATADGQDISLTRIKEQLKSICSCDILLHSSSSVLVVVSTSNKVPQIIEGMKRFPEYNVKKYKHSDSLTVAAKWCRVMIVPTAGSFLLAVSLYCLFRTYSLS